MLAYTHRGGQISIKDGQIDQVSRDSHKARDYMPRSIFTQLTMFSNYMYSFVPYLNLSQL